GSMFFKQLFLNGERQTRARIPNYGEGFYYTERSGVDVGRKAMKYKEEQFKSWKNLNDVEVVIYQSWNESRLIVSDLDQEEKIVTFTGPIGRRVTRNRYYIDNVFEGLDQPGEWYLDRNTGQLFYWPAENMKDAEFRVPVLNEILRFEGEEDIEREPDLQYGDVEKVLNEMLRHQGEAEKQAEVQYGNLVKKGHVKYINIRGLTFCETSYILPKEGIPVIRDVGDIWFPSAITLKGVSDCIFENNTIRNTGTYGLDITGDAIHVKGNKIYDIGSGGIVTRSYGGQRNVISYNHIHDCGLVFHSGVGINIDDGGGLIANNLIHHTSHSGVYVRHHSTDYGQGPERRNQEQGLIIEYNEIYEVMHGSNDGAGIFVRDDNIVIRNNLIHDIWAVPGGIGSPGWGIYLGCKTRNTLIENNVVYRAQSGQMIWFMNRNNTFFNNIFVNGPGYQIQYSNNSDAYHHNIRFLRNIIYYSDPDASLYRFSYSSGRSMPSESDYNLIYNTGNQDLKILGLPGVESFEDWQKLGYDTHSIVADPLFVDPGNNDYSLRPESPAFKLGFKPIDLSRVGLRGIKEK
ncbi:right-handed parallel beta-helix repeat-containing protein, partial [Bacteroidota bacterium]